MKTSLLSYGVPATSTAIAPTSESVLSFSRRREKGHLKRTLQVIWPSSRKTKPSATSKNVEPKPDVMCRVFGSFHSGFENRADNPHCTALIASMRIRAKDLVVLSWRTHHSPSEYHCPAPVALLPNNHNRRPGNCRGR